MEPTLCGPMTWNLTWGQLCYWVQFLPLWTQLCLLWQTVITWLKNKARRRLGDRCFFAGCCFRFVLFCFEWRRGCLPNLGYGRVSAWSQPATLWSGPGSVLHFSKGQQRTGLPGHCLSSLTQFTQWLRQSPTQKGHPSPAARARF